MSDKKDEDGTMTGNVVGFQIPMGIKQRKAKVDELLKMFEDINEADVLSYWNGLSDKDIGDDCRDLDASDYSPVADRIRDHVVREVVRNRMKEVVRKKPGGGGYVLYSPNQGKKKPAKPVGSFPTKIGAKRAELARFPPKDPAKLKRLRKEVDKLLKDPKKASEKEKEAENPRHKVHHKGAPHHEVPKKAGGKEETKPKAKEKESKKEGLEIVRDLVRQTIAEGLFHEEKTGSDWDDVIGRLSKNALQGDAKFQQLQKNIEKRASKVLEDAFGAIAKNVDRKKVKLKNHGVKQQEGRTYLAFSATMSNVECGPMAIYIDGSTPKIELSDQAKAALTKVEPEVGKLFRAELVTVQERVLDKMDDLERAVVARDKYLTGLESEVDNFASDLTPLQMSLLKNLLIKKYRKV
jgi:hypothetical protein